MVGVGIVAYSKVCTHAGCPVGLYRHQPPAAVPVPPVDLRRARRCRPVFGPAPARCPSCRFAVDAEGFLIAQSDYAEPVGPGFWNRG